MKLTMIKALLPLALATSTFINANEITLEQFTQKAPISLEAQQVLSLEAQDQLLRGDHKDNGGDGFYNDQERIILRDFIASNYFAELSSDELLELIPEFKEFNKEIFELSASIAITLSEAMKELKFIVVNEKLPKLAQETTSFSSLKGDVQVAIRRGDIVLISKPALNELENREYLVFHEIMHGLVKKHENWSPMKHTIVRSLTNKVKLALGNSTKEEFEQIFKDHGVEVPYMTNSRVERILEQVTSQKELSTEACGLYKLLERSPSLQSYQLEGFLKSNYKGAKQCAERTDIDLGKLYAPNSSTEFQNYISSHGKTVRSTFVYEVRTDNVRAFSRIKKIIKDQCKQYAAKELEKNIQQRNIRLSGLLADQAIFLSDFDKMSGELEIAHEYIINDVLNINPRWSENGTLGNAIKGNESALKKVQDNRKSCKQRFPFTKF